jgi:hypothetical protein
VAGVQLDFDPNSSAFSTLNKTLINQIITLA